MVMYESFGTFLLLWRYKPRYKRTVFAGSVLILVLCRLLDGSKRSLIKYEPDYHRATPLYDATIALGRHACGRLNNKVGNTESAILNHGYELAPASNPNTPKANAAPLQTGELIAMQHEMVSIMSRVDSRDVDLVGADSEATALVNRVKQATPFHVSDLRCARTTKRHPSDEADEGLSSTLSSKAVARGYGGGADLERRAKPRHAGTGPGAEEVF